MTASPAGPTYRTAPAAAPQGTGHCEHGRARIAGGPGGDPHDPAPVLVALGAGHGQQRGHIGVLQRLQLRLTGQREPDVDEAHGPGVLPRGVDEQTRLVCSEGDGQIGAYGGSADLARVGVDAAGQIDGDDGGAGLAQHVDELGGVGAQPALAADPDDAVDDEIGAPEGLLGRVRPSHDPPSGAHEGGEAAGVGAVGYEQDGCDPGAAFRQPGTGVEGVAPVVTAADEQHDPGAVDPPQKLGAGGDEPGHGPLHQRPLREPSHQLLLGNPHGLHAVSSTHEPESPSRPTYRQRIAHAGRALPKPLSRRRRTRLPQGRGGRRNLSVFAP